MNAPAQAAAPAALSAAIDRLFADCAGPDTPGAAILVTQHGRVLHKAGYGMAEIDRGIPITPQTRLHLGSVTKHICAAGLLMLEEQGALGLDDPVGRFLTDLQPVVAAIPLRQLLAMNSGLFDGLNLPLFAGMESGTLSQERHYDILRRVDRLMFPTGDQHTYSNSNYLLISRVIERVSGATLADFMRDTVFAPLGMDNTALAATPSTIHGRARGYALGPGGAAPAPDMAHLCADGGIVTTLDDMQLWLAHFAHGRIGVDLLRDRLGEEVLLNDGGRTGYGLGMSVGEALGRPKLSHAGGMPGYVADLAYFPDDDLGVVMMSNALRPDLIERTDQIAALALGRPAPARAPAANMNALGGVYICRPLSCTAELAREGDDAVLHLMGERLSLASSERGFRVAKPGVLLEIRTSTERLHGRPVLDFVWGDGRAYAFTPFAESDVGPFDLDAYVGAYRSPLLGETHVVSRKGDQLSIGLGSALRAVLWSGMKPRGGDMFSCVIPGEASDTDVTIQFQRGADGAVTSLEYTLSRTRALRFEKAP